MAQREDLGDLKLYRIPIPVTVAANSQKQVALLEQPQVKMAAVYRWDTAFAQHDTDEPAPAERVLKMDNRKADGLGLPLPAGSFTLYTMREGRPFLLGEGRMTDRAVGEDGRGLRWPMRPAFASSSARSSARANCARRS